MAYGQGLSNKSIAILRQFATESKNFLFNELIVRYVYCNVPILPKYLVKAETFPGDGYHQIPDGSGCTHLGNGTRYPATRL